MSSVEKQPQIVDWIRSLLEVGFVGSVVLIGLGVVWLIIGGPIVAASNPDGELHFEWDVAWAYFSGCSIAAFWCGLGVILVDIRDQLVALKGQNA